MNSFFKPVGRITRRRFLLLFIIFFFTNLLALLLMYTAYHAENWTSFILNGMILVFTIFVLIIQSIKRLHDIGLPWKYALYLLIPPPINLIGFIWLGYKEGQIGNNQYGEDPKKTDVLA